MGRYLNNNTRPIVGANVITLNVCVVTKAQMAAREQGENNDEENDLEGDSTLDCYGSDMDSKNKDEDSNDANSDEEAREKNKQLGKDLIRENEWQRKKYISKDEPNHPRNANRRRQSSFNTKGVHTFVPSTSYDEEMPMIIVVT